VILSVIGMALMWDLGSLVDIVGAKPDIQQMAETYGVTAFTFASLIGLFMFASLMERLHLSPPIF